MNVSDLRARIGQEFDNECHLTADEARLLFDVLAAAYVAVDARNPQGDALLLRAVNAARKAGT